MMTNRLTFDGNNNLVMHGQVTTIAQALNEVMNRILPVESAINQLKTESDVQMSQLQEHVSKGFTGSGGKCASRHIT